MTQFASLERSNRSNFENLKIERRAERKISASACTRSMPAGSLLSCYAFCTLYTFFFVLPFFEYKVVHN